MSPFSPAAEKLAEALCDLTADANHEARRLLYDLRDVRDYDRRVARIVEAAYEITKRAQALRPMVTLRPVVSPCVECNRDPDDLAEEVAS